MEEVALSCSRASHIVGWLRLTLKRRRDMKIDAGKAILLVLVSSRSFCSIMSSQPPPLWRGDRQIDPDDWRLCYDPRELYRANWAPELCAT